MLIYFKKYEFVMINKKKLKAVNIFKEINKISISILRIPFIVYSKFQNYFNKIYIFCIPHYQ